MDACGIFQDLFFMASQVVQNGKISIAPIMEQAPGADQARLLKAVKFADQIYAKRSLDLQPEITLLSHAMETTTFLAEFCRDDDALVACILQHALKCPDVTLAEIGKEFGRGVRDMVSRIHLLSHLYTTDWRKSIDDMKIMLVSVADDVRVLLIALSVASVLLANLKKVRAEYRMRICRQSLQLFAPMAARLGIYALKYRLERSAFPETYPSDAQLIGQQLKNVQAEHGAFLNRTAGALRDFLREEGIEAEVMAREKQPYSIFQKMQSKSVTALEKISDLFAIRVVVKSLPDCYQALGLLHRLATPISHRFKDYISFPKPNGYQSLHTCLMGLPHAPNDVMIEVQIRTEEMHREAEYGVAAHWFYKEAGKNSVLGSAKQLQLSDVLLKQQTVGSDESGKPDTLTLVDHIYVLTPRGDIIELPDGGTPLDFAFVLHSDLGLRFKAARVNGSIVPISYKLENGDVVEIMTHKYPQPALQWLEELVTSSARAKLKAYFFSHNRTQFLTKGREMVNAELRTRGQDPLDTECSILSSHEGQSLSVKDREDLLVKVGMGSVRTSSILRHISARRPEKPRIAKAPKGAGNFVKQAPTVAIKGQPLSMPYRFAKCCSPHTADPRPDSIVGIVTRAGVINVHRESCHMVKGGNPERKLKMYWE